MKANAEPLEGNQVKLSVELDEAEVEQAMDKAYKTIARQVNIPGFRPGKAPRRLIEAKVGADAARAQALNDSIPDFYVKAIRETDIEPIASPKVDITSGETEGPVTFEAVIDVRPVPNIAGYQGLQVTVPNPQPTDEDVDAQIERLRAQYGELELVERPAAKGDFVTIDIRGEHDGEAVPGLTASDYSYEVGTGLQSLGEEFDNQVQGSSAGDTLEFTTPVPPNDDEVSFHVEVKAVNERKLPELDDEWVNEASEFESVEELRNDIATRLAEMRKLEATQALRGASISALAELVDDDIPEPLVDQEMQRQLQDIAYRLQQQGFGLAQYLEITGQSQEDFVEQLRDASTDSVRADLALRSLAQKENLEVTDEDIDNQVNELAEQFGQKPARVRKDLERNDQLPVVISDIRKAKAVRWLMDHVDVVDADGKAVDRSLLNYDEAQLGHEGHDHSGGSHGASQGEN